MAETPETEKSKERPESSMPFGEKELFESRTVLILSPVSAKLAHMVNSRLFALERANPTDPIFVYINSPGGEVHSGYAIFDTLRFIECPVITIVTGLAASMGSIIALAAKKQHRMAMPNSKFLIHQPSVQGGLAGSVSDIEIHARDLIDTKNQIVDLYVQETGRSTEEVRKAIDRDKWMNASQAKEFGLISSIVARRSDIKI